MKVDSLPRFYYKSSMPNFSQFDSRNQAMHGYEGSLCGPIAVSNILIYLARRNFQMLLPPMGNQTELQAHFKLVEKLTKCMRTSKKTGTHWHDAIEGIEKYICERGYKVKISYDEGSCDLSGCRKVNNPAQIMKSVIGPSNAILSIAWCRVTPSSLKYWQTGEHFATLAGFARSEVNKLIIHDPGFSSTRAPEYAELQEIKKGFCKYWVDRKFHSAEGFYELDGIEIDTEKGANRAVLDGIIEFEVFRK